MHSHRHGKGWGWVAVLGMGVAGCSQPPAAPRESLLEAQSVPRITSTFQSEFSVVAGTHVTFRVMAVDSQARALTIAWRANTGALGAAVADSAQSEVEWTPPPCVLTGTTPAITATVTNAAGLSASSTFTLTGATACLAGRAPPRSSRILSLQSESVAWSSR
jgi:hypothetical protein